MDFDILTAWSIMDPSKYKSPYTAWILELIWSIWNLFQTLIILSTFVFINCHWSACVEKKTWLKAMWILYRYKPRHYLEDICFLIGFETALDLINGIFCKKYRSKPSMKNACYLLIRSDMYLCPLIVIKCRDRVIMFTLCYNIRHSYM